MRVWRLAKSEYATLDGEGSRLYGGRWTSPGHRVVYVGSNLSLCVLEAFVHLPAALRSPAAFPEMLAIEVEMPDDSVRDLRFRAAELAALVVEEGRAAGMFRRYGDVWARHRNTLALKVPSIVVPLEYNYILNVAHRRFADVRVVATHPFAFDPRLASPASLA